MKGDFVVVRSFTGALIRRVWEDHADTVSIVTTENFENLSGGKDELDAVGVHRTDVFKHDPLVDGDLVSGTVNWDRLRPY